MAIRLSDLTKDGSEIEVISSQDEKKTPKKTLIRLSDLMKKPEYKDINELIDTPLQIPLNPANPYGGARFPVGNLPAMQPLDKLIRQANLRFVDQFLGGMGRPIARSAGYDIPETQNPLETLGAYTGGAAGALAGPWKVGGVITKKILPMAIRNKLFDSMVRNASMAGIAGLLEAPQKVQQEGTAKDILALPERGIQGLQGAVLGAGFGVAARGVEKFLQPATEKLDDVIKVSIAKAIRPSVSGKQNYNQYQNYFKDANTAVKAIVANKGNLQFTDEAGNVVNKLPESLEDFSQAVYQTKRNIFNQYDALAKQAGSKGITVDLKPIADEILDVAATKEIQTLHPEIVDYALEKSSLLEKAKNFTLEEAQREIKNLNQKLQTFYSNPTYETAQKIQIDAAIANNLRKSLDDAVTKTTGKQYQQLRNTYKSLRTVEADINRRAIVDARKNYKGFFDLTDVFSSGDIAKGIMAINPAEMTKGMIEKAASYIYKRMNDPNRVIKSMFKQTDKIINKK